MLAVARKRDALAMLHEHSHTARLACFVRDAMQARGETLAAIESCTGGLVASTLTDVPRSGYLLGSAVAYSPEVKVKFGVPPSIIVAHGTISSAVALSLAECAAAWFEADYGIGVTGVAGPASDEGKPPGTAFAAVWSRERGGVVLPIAVSGDRAGVKANIAHLAIALLVAELDGDPEAPTPEVQRWLEACSTPEYDDPIDRQSDDSFPASDPPSFSPVVGAGTPDRRLVELAAGRR